MATNITWHNSHVARSDRERHLNQRGVTVCKQCTSEQLFANFNSLGFALIVSSFYVIVVYKLWFTGLSGSGKSTVATALERELLLNHKKATYVLDGDNIRHGLCSDLGFGPTARQENIRRIGEVCNLFTDAGIIVLAAFVSPYNEDRDKVRSLLEGGERQNFIEIHVQASVATCEERDPKGLYKRARAGEIPNFTGISAPFEAPENPEVVLNTGEKSVEDCVAQLVTYLKDGGYLSAE